MSMRRYRLGGLAALCMICILVTAVTDTAFASEAGDEDLLDQESDIEDYEDYEVTDEDDAEADEVLKKRAAQGKGLSRYQHIHDPMLQVSYDEETGYFTYIMPNGGSFMMNVPLGGISDEAVDIVAGDDSWIDGFYEDGIPSLENIGEYDTVDEMLSSVSDDEVMEVTADTTGRYDFLMRSMNTKEDGITVNSSHGSFGITRSDIPIWINVISAPYGYEMEQVTMNGHDTEASGTLLELEEDGLYEIVFRPVKSGLPVWTSCFTRDTTAPVLRFTPALTEAVSERPVSFYPSEADARIRVYLNNKEISLQNMTASADGDYRISVSDGLGNENTYYFTIDTEEKFPYEVYLYILLFLVAGGAILIITSHRGMRIL